MSDLKPFEIPGHLVLAEGNGGLPKLLIETPFSTAEIYLHGAHVTAFRKTGEPPLLFMSASSSFSMDTAIRGGVPVIFPWFGPREGLPAHGFARAVEWDLLESELLDDGCVRVRLSMPSLKSYEVEYRVTVGETLTLELTVGNTDKKEASFESCLHTYFQVGSIDTVTLTGLKDTGYFDKVRETGALETGNAIRITEETDRVYFDTAATVAIQDPSLGRTIHVSKSGSGSTVVWNPWIEKSKRLPDLGDEDYQRMVCVESGNIGKNKVTLPPCGRTTLKVVLSSIPS
jgi:glucose-6-phosphate 1-epimerase